MNLPASLGLASADAQSGMDVRNEPHPLQTGEAMFIGRLPEH